MPEFCGMVTAGGNQTTIGQECQIVDRIGVPVEFAGQFKLVGCPHQADAFDPAGREMCTRLRNRKPVAYRPARFAES